MEAKLHQFQTVALVEVSGLFHALVALLSAERTPLHRRSADTRVHYFGRGEELDLCLCQ